MTTDTANEVYEAYMGRWSRLVGDQFLELCANDLRTCRIDFGSALVDRLREREAQALVDVAIYWINCKHERRLRHSTSNFGSFT